MSEFCARRGTVAQNQERRRRERLTAAPRHLGYALTQKKRKRIEECFGWLETIALMRKLRHRGVCKVDWILYPGFRRLQPGTHPQPDG
jgi:hypothetical protein